MSKVLTIEGVPPPYQTTLPPLPNATLVLTICQDNTHIESQLLWPTKHVPKELKPLRGYDIHIYRTGSGWQTRFSFERMMLKRILPKLIRRRKKLGLKSTPILLLLDGHSSRLCPPVLHFARVNNIIILTFPAHTSHITQPLDLSPNGIFKRALRTAIASYIQKHSITHITLPIYRTILAAVIPPALMTALRNNVVRCGWERAGFKEDYPSSPLYVLSTLPHGPLPPPPKRGLNISAQVITEDPIFSIIDQSTKIGKSDGKPTDSLSATVSSTSQSDQQVKNPDEEYSTDSSDLDKWTEKVWTHEKCASALGSSLRFRDEHPPTSHPKRPRQEADTSIKVRRGAGGKRKRLDTEQVTTDSFPEKTDKITPAHPSNHTLIQRDQTSSGSDSTESDTSHSQSTSHDSLSSSESSTSSSSSTVATTIVSSDGRRLRTLVKKTQAFPQPTTRTPSPKTSKRQTKPSPSPKKSRSIAHQKSPH